MVSHGARCRLPFFTAGRRVTRLVLRAALGVGLALALALGGGWWFGRHQVLSNAEETLAKGASIGRKWLAVYRSTDGPPRRRARAARRALSKGARPCRADSVVPLRTSEDGQVVIGHHKRHPGLVLQLRHQAFPRNALCMPLGKPHGGLDRTIVLGLAGVLILSVLAGLAWPLTRRLRRIEAVVRQVAAGNLETRVADPADDAVGSLGRAVDAMSFRIRELLAAQRHQSAAASHQLRTPLARIAAAADLLEEHPSRRLIDGIRADVAELDHLVGELLTLARLQDPGANDRLNTVDLAALVIDRVAAASRDERAAIKVAGADCPAFVHADSGLLARLLDTLLSNASAHGGKHIEVTLETESGELTLTVDDDGPGIPEHERQRVMRAFERGAETRGAGGLGLAIADQIAQRHRGSLRIEDSPLGGARLRLRLPALEGDPAQHRS
jgi:signal transduction histidine kinase